MANRGAVVLSEISESDDGSSALNVPAKSISMRVQHSQGIRPFQTQNARPAQVPHPPEYNRPAQFSRPSSCIKEPGPTLSLAVSPSRPTFRPIAKRIPVTTTSCTPGLNTRGNGLWFLMATFIIVCEIIYCTFLLGL